MKLDDAGAEQGGWGGAGGWGVGGGGGKGGIHEVPAGKHVLADLLDDLREHGALVFDGGHVLARDAAAVAGVFVAGALYSRLHIFGRRGSGLGARGCAVGFPHEAKAHAANFLHAAAAVEGRGGEGGGGGVEVNGEGRGFEKMFGSFLKNTEQMNGGLMGIGKGRRGERGGGGRGGGVGTCRQF